MPAPGQKQIVEVGGRELTLTNLQKILYPSGFTKGQVIDYYVRIADVLLPHLKGRPITMKRYPDGIEGVHFYEKDAPSFTPKWMRTFNVARRGREGSIDYIVIDDLPTLVCCANAANLEIHPFLHRAPNINRPTAIVFDLDPGEGVDVLDCAEVAFLLKDALEASGLQSMAKVSGSKGLQVYVPLNTAVTYERSQPYAKSLAERLEREHLDRVIAKMTKSARNGKVFIDWSQNADFKTTVAVYSLRAKRATPYVSMPVTWAELRTALRKRDAAGLFFEPEAALKRVQKRGDLFEPLLTLKQKL